MCEISPILQRLFSNSDRIAKRKNGDGPISLLEVEGTASVGCLGMKARRFERWGGFW